MNRNPMLAHFDFPDPNTHNAVRFETTTPLQKKFLLNSEFMVFNANVLANQLTQHGSSTRPKIEHAYKLLFSLGAKKLEFSLAEQSLSPQDTNTGTQKTSSTWAQDLQAVLISNKMFMVD